MKKLFPKFGNMKGMRKSIAKIQEREGNEKIHPIIRERESEAIILGNVWEPESLLTPFLFSALKGEKTFLRFLLRGRAHYEVQIDPGQKSNRLSKKRGGEM